MPREFSRTERVNEQIKRSLSTLLRDYRPVDDLLTVTGVDVSPDFRQALVYVSALAPKEEDKTALCRDLNEAAPRLRHALAGQLNLRRTPRLRFRFDAASDRGARIDALLKG
jgi:ribosome-binding factor A